MNNQEYEQKKRECWEEFCRHIVDEQEEFYSMFDRSYALGKQTEVISQEEIEKLANEFAELKTVKQAGSSVERDRKALLMTQFFRFAMDRLSLGKQEKDTEDTVISGWVARDKDSDKLYIYGYKPERLSNMWYSPGAPFEMEISSDYFHDITWESDPIEVELIIKRKKKEMTTELQNKAWSVLPKELKEEVKYQYHNFNCYNHTANIEVKEILEYLFGHHNLTSDTEGEEMLTVNRKRVQDIYAQCEKIEMDDSPNLPAETIDAASTKMALLSSLFGSKCLLDTSNIVSNAASPSQNPPENCDSEPHTSTECDKPAEPKFKVGDKVVCSNYPHVYRQVTAIMEDGSYVLDGAIYDVIESDLEPYTEPAEQSHNLSQETVNCDKQFNYTLKNSFSKEHRLNIAVMAMQSLLSNPYSFTVDGKDQAKTPENIAEVAFLYADALIDKSML